MPLVQLARYYNGLEAGIVRGKLAAAGIDSVLFDFDTAIEGVGFVVPVRLMVLDEDLAAAQAVIASEPDPLTENE